MGDRGVRRCEHEGRPRPHAGSLQGRRTAQAPADALEAARSAVRGVRGSLREHGIGDEAVEGSRLDLKSAYEYGDGGRKFVGYQCQAAFAIESAGLDDVESLLIDIVAAGANEIEAVEFDVRS